jgi:hypothetical protein
MAASLISKLKNDARRAAKRGDAETVDRYVRILATLMPQPALATFRSELDREEARQ